MKIWAKTIVRNEERYIWFSIMSVIDYMDRILVWDTGSDDKTVEIVKEIKNKYPNKIEFREIGAVDTKQYTKVSQKMLEEFKCDWLINLDGDEVWWEDSIRRVVAAINDRSDDLDTIVQPYYNIVGDIYHYQDEEAGQYKFDGKVGHLTIRALNRSIPGLHFDNEHGQLGLFDENDKLIQERSPKRRIYLNYPYMHFTNMLRSETKEKNNKVPKRAFKLKYDLGNEFALDFYYPEVFFKSRPSIVPNPWSQRSREYFVKAVVQSPLKRLKRVIGSASKTGY